MRNVGNVVALMGVLALVACGDNEGTVYEDAGTTVDLPSVDLGQTTDTNQQGEGGVQDIGGTVEDTRVPLRAPVRRPLHGAPDRRSLARASPHGRRPRPPAPDPAAKQSHAIVRESARA